jgi:hypothetical protein
MKSFVSVSIPSLDAHRFWLLYGRKTAKGMNNIYYHPNIGLGSIMETVAAYVQSPFCRLPPLGEDGVIISLARLQLGQDACNFIPEAGIVALRPE